MNPLDDLFREGLGARKADVPGDLWRKINARRPAAVPGDEELDRLFAARLADRTAPVPAGLWPRIRAAAGFRQPQPWRYALAAAAAVLLLLVTWVTWERTAPPHPATAGVTAPAADSPATATPIPSLDRVHDLEAGFLPGSRASVAGAAEARPPIGVPDGAAPNPPVAATEPATATTKIPPAPAAGAIATDASALPVPAPTSSGADVAAGREARVPGPARPRPQIYQVAELSASPAVAALPVPDLLPEPRRHYRPKPRPGGSFKAAPRHRSQTEFLFGLGYANQQFTLNTEDARALRSAREVSEFPEVSYQVTLRQSYRLNDRLTAIGGLTYAAIRNQFEFERLVNGREELRKVNNHLRLLEAPLLLGYSLPGKKRLQVSLNAGPVVNLVTAVNGRYLDPAAAEPRDLAADGDYRGNIGLGVMTSLTTTYLIGKQDPFLLVVEPYFKSYLGSFTRSAAPLQERYWVGGVQFGVRKAF